MTILTPSLELRAAELLPLVAEDAQLRLYVIAYWASAMTWSIADLTCPAQFLGKGMGGGVV
jgi:hypothetical protein